MASRHSTEQRLLFDNGPPSKRCSQCGTVKALSDFRPRPQGREGRVAECRACNRLRQQRWAAKNKTKNQTNPPPASGLTKRCSYCRQTKPVGAFFRWPKSKDGFMYCCKPCRAAEKKAEAQRVANDPEAKRKHQQKKRHRHYERVYGMDAGDYAAMHRRQGGVCAICGRPETARLPDGRTKSLSVDHCHRTGRIRSLLCNHCNQGIGHFRDSPALLRAAAAYLEKHA